MGGRPPMMNRCAHIYELFLRCYPDRFQRRFFEEMVLDFEDGCAAANACGTLALVVYVAHAFMDVLKTLVEQWMASGKTLVAGTALCATIGAWSAMLYVASWEWKGTNKPLGARWPPQWTDTAVSRLVLPTLTDQVGALMVMAGVALCTILVVLALTYWLLLPQ